MTAYGTPPGRRFSRQAQVLWKIFEAGSSTQLRHGCRPGTRVALERSLREVFRKGCLLTLESYSSRGNRALTIGPGGVVNIQIYGRYSRSLHTLHNLPDHSSVQLDGDDLLGLLQQADCEVTRTGTDLQNDVRSLDGRSIHDPLNRSG